MSGITGGLMRGPMPRSEDAVYKNVTGRTKAEYIKELMRNRDVRTKFAADLLLQQQVHMVDMQRSAQIGGGISRQLGKTEGLGGSSSFPPPHVADNNRYKEECENDKGEPYTRYGTPEYTSFFIDKWMDNKNPLRFLRDELNDLGTYPLKAQLQKETDEWLSDIKLRA